MSITLTLREALAIQAEQVRYYSKYRSDLADVVASKTNVEGHNLDTLMPVVEVNKLVPRGGDIEYLCGLSDVQRKERIRARDEALRMFVEWGAERSMVRDEEKS